MAAVCLWLWALWLLCCFVAPLWLYGMCGMCRRHVRHVRVIAGQILEMSTHNMNTLQMSPVHQTVPKPFQNRTKPFQTVPNRTKIVPKPFQNCTKFYQTVPNCTKTVPNRTKYIPKLYTGLIYFRLCWGMCSCFCVGMCMVCAVMCPACAPPVRFHSFCFCCVMLIFRWTLGVCGMCGHTCTCQFAVFRHPTALLAISSLAKFGAQSGRPHASQL